jgi:hypothetical protein
MWSNVAPLLLLLVAAWVGTAMFVGARRYTFKPYYLAALACSLIVFASVGSILAHVSTDRVYEQILWTGMFLFMVTALLFRNEELRRGIEYRKILIFKDALASPSRDNGRRSHRF